MIDEHGGNLRIKNILLPCRVKWKVLNMKKIFSIGVALVMLVSFAALPSINAGTETISVVLNSSPPSANISVSPPEYQPPCPIAGSNQTTGGVYNLTNEGLVQVDVTINASGTADWTLGDAGHNQFNLTYNSTSSWVAITNSAESFVTNFPPQGSGSDHWQTFDLGVDMPTSTSTADVQYTNITFVATTT